MTIGKVTVEFQVAIPQGLTAPEVNDWLLSVLSDAVEDVNGIIEFDTIDVLTQTKVDPFTPAEVQEFKRPGPLPLALR